MGEAIKLGGAGLLKVRNGTKLKLPVLDSVINANTFVKLATVQPQRTEANTYTYPADGYVYIEGAVEIAENKYLLYGTTGSIDYDFAQVVQYNPANNTASFGDYVKIGDDQIIQQKGIKIEDRDGKQRVLYSRVYQRISNSEYADLKSRILTIDGLNITVGGTTTHTSSTNRLESQVYLGNNRVLITYTNLYTPYSVILDVSGNTPSAVSATLQLASYGSAMNAGRGSGDYDAETGHVFLASVTSYSSPYYLALYALKIDGNTITQVATTSVSINSNGKPTIVKAKSGTEFGVVCQYANSTLSNTTHYLAACTVKLINNTLSVSFENLGVALTDANGSYTGVNASQTANYNLEKGIVMYFGHVILFQNTPTYVGYINLLDNIALKYNVDGFALLSVTSANPTLAQFIKTTQAYGLTASTSKSVQGITATGAKKGALSNVYLPGV